jgi:UDP-N-acetyl-D-mannosaminuronic acid transferase (WecB/TagA/CpsF family)
MNKWIVPIVGAAFLISAAGFAQMVAQAQQGAARVFIPGGQPVNEEQVRAKLQSEGWSGVVIAREGQYLRATGAVGGQLRTVVIDAATGRLGQQEDNDDDDY